MKAKTQRGPKPTLAKRRAYRKQLPKGRLPECHYVQPYPVYYYPYPYPPYQYQYSKPPYYPPTHGSAPPGQEPRPRVQYQFSMPAAPLPPPMGDSSPRPQANSPQETTLRSTASSGEAKKPIDPPCLTEESASTEGPSSDVEMNKTEESVSTPSDAIVPHENDVLMGRGGKNNTHVGNETLRDMARAMREVYIKSRKKVKTEMALQLVQQVFGLNPPGRFLQRDPVTMAWEEVDLEVARHKASQCLRDAASEKPSAVKKQDSKPGPEIARATTPVHSNLANKIEPSPPRRQSMEVGVGEVRNRFGSWEPGSASLASNLVECWEKNNGSFVKSRRASMEPVPRQHMWEASGRELNVIEYLDVEDANLIPAEELDAVADGMESFSLLDESQLEVDMQVWQPDCYEEAENPFDTEFF